MKDKLLKQLMRRSIGLLLCPLMLCFGLPAWSAPTYDLADVTVSGIVTDDTGEPLPGATVQIKGTNKGTITDVTGKYTISAPEDGTLVFSFIGYEKQEIAVGSRSSIDVQLAMSAESLEEVVVVGYGTMRKKDLTGAIVQVEPEKIANENPNTVQDILRGTPGVSVGYDPSAKGGGSIRIRGQRSVYSDGGHNNPQIILDGMIFYGELSEINPDDIAQIDVLKDASAAAVYGARAANGVLIITTKKGKVGKPVINVTSTVGLTTKSVYRNVFGPDAYMDYREDWYKKDTYGVNATSGEYEAYQTDAIRDMPGFYDSPENLSQYGVSIDDWRAYTTNETGESDESIYAKRLGLEGGVLNDYLAGRTFDWYDHTFRTGVNKDLNVSVSGANDKMNYYMSVGYLKNQGAVQYDDYQAVRSNMKVNGKVTDWLEVGANVNFQDRSDGSLTPGLGENYWDLNQIRNSPYSHYYDLNDDGTLSEELAQFPMGDDVILRGHNYDFDRQFLELEKGYTVLNTMVNAKVKLPFDITYSFNASPRYQWFYDRYFMSADLPLSSPVDRGVNREQTKRFDWSLNNTITWDHFFGDRHHVMLTLVQEAEARQSWQDRIIARNIQPSDALGFHNVSNATMENSSISSYDTRQTADALMARLFYSYDDRYMVTASVRRDGYSAFGQNNPYATFPSIAGAWTFSNENFMLGNDVLSTGKLRLSWGENGNRSLANPYMALANLSSGAGATMGYVVGSGMDEVKYLLVDRLENPNLRWEKTQSWNVGLDYGLFDDRIFGSIEYYSMKTSDMIMNQRLPGFTGFGSITTNLGEVTNKGIEIAINSTNVRNEIFEWNTSFTFSYNKNEIKHLYYEDEDILDEEGNVIGTKEADDIPNGWFIGQPIGAIWNYEVTGIWQADEAEEAALYNQRPGDPKIANNYTADDIDNGDGTFTPVYNDKDKEFLGQTAPPINWQLRNDFTIFKNLNISFNIYSYMGHKSLAYYYLNQDNGGSLITYNYNTFEKDYWTPENPSNEYARLDARAPAGASAGKLYDRSFIRLENISVGYTLPAAWTDRYNIDKVKVYGTIRNVGVWQKDWEYGDPETGGLATRIYSIGLNLTL
ncbi:SusC/RagA family TonB-linked outer membrane protein [Reichenbachiella ulvae]|uniref:SusC/RagA family TonB-linked outer membrane protein n=1 Tax=Reichenbachiella ulvae TaxID=2980104 RepID=A0ABT3CUR6_9BACT|nr:SusC/RagA family TonB-linked outer membrane protein [Reichenbachiella ulvae]MCV9387377.1 SusC/RagA family TonB-linked outer membrane protein [Reichenbachiella ulvae]